MAPRPPTWSSSGARRPTPERVAEALGALGGPARALFVTQSETSTGVVNDVRALAEVAREHNTLLVVDAISGLGAVDLPQDEWGIDVVVSGSQKSLMTPPGLAFASVSERALAAADENPGRRYYFDWAKTAKGQREQPANSPFTPAVTLWRALDVALEQIFEEGLEEVFERHAILARATRAGVEAMGLERFGPDDPDANVVTAARMPDSIDGAAVPKLMRDRLGITVAGGQGHLKGKIVRVAHCGYYGAFDIVVALTGLEMALRSLGHDCEPGVGGRRRPAGLRGRGRRTRAGRLAPWLRTPSGSWSRSGSPIPASSCCKATSRSTSASRCPTQSWPSKIGDYDAILIRSGTKLTAELIDRADRLQVIGRAGTGVDNVDVEAATRRGIVVANAPESNSVAAAEHTLALILALYRNVPQAHGSLTAGQWERSELRRIRALRQDPRGARVRPHRPARRPARAVVRDGGRRLRQVRLRGALPRARGGGGRGERRALLARRRDQPAPSEDAGDGQLDRRRDDRADEATG